MERQAQRNRYVLVWSDPIASGRRPSLLGHETYGRERVADLLAKVEELLAYRYAVSITPPLSTATVTIAASEAICDV